jgi:hypothetical protein
MDRNKKTYFIKKSIALYLLLCTTITSYAQIIESDKLSIILDYIDTSNTLVVFDIDNTIAHPTEELGSDEWSCHWVNQKMAMGYDEVSSVYYSHPIYFYVQFNILLQPTEPIVPALIAYLIDNGIATMALTARSLFIAERTLEQLKKINITFFLPGISPDDLILPTQRLCFYKNGIIFTDGSDKGECLQQFFAIMGYYPEKVIFVDDKMKHILAVEKVVEELNIAFCGIRYSGCDEKVKNFDPAKAEQQYRELRKRNE